MRASGPSESMATKPPPGALRKISATYRDRGAGGLLRAALDRIYERTEFVAMQRDLRHPTAPPHCTLDFELRQIDDARLERFKDLPYPFSRHYQYRFEQGQRRCYGALVGDQIVALMWPLFAADNPRLVTRWRYLLPDEARISSIWADPRVRGTGLMAACIERFATYVRAHGFCYLYAFTWVNNQASIRLHERLGFRTVGRIRRHSLRWQEEGRGLYLRTPIPRDPMPATHPGGDLELPAVLP